ncbi:hypothetical protein HYN59_13130 [Flavobacterium album]|uniref:Uncharacterized protein n=1 Tax=Flavobacterium album TaxID=2175091 RepID=A0A2S1QZZ4_9FLAO|nr:hypothetical protein HYN59_13130 [Flavobacterium album]
MENNIKRGRKECHHKDFKPVPARLTVIENEAQPQVEVISIHRNYYKQVKYPAIIFAAWSIH